jgi:hypothetical protein
LAVGRGQVGRPVAVSAGGELFAHYGLAEFVPLNRLKGRDRLDMIRRLLTAGSLETALREADSSK